MSTVISTGVTDEMDERIEALRDDGESKSAVVRRLIRDGLRAEETGERVPLRLVVAWLGSLIAAAALVSPASTTSEAAGILGLGTFAVAITYPRAIRRFR